jgi:hypothetical protein
MPELNDEQLDALLGDFLKESLDPQQGRAEQHFVRYLQGEARVAWKQRTWLIGAFLSGMAASVAALWAAPLFRATHKPDRVQQNAQLDPRHSIVSAKPIPPAMQRDVQSQTIDEGVLVLDDNTPYRVLRRRAIERTRWFNEQAKVQNVLVTPKDDLIFIKLTTN